MATSSEYRRRIQEEERLRIEDDLYRAEASNSLLRNSKPESSEGMGFFSMALLVVVVIVITAYMTR